MSATVAGYMPDGTPIHSVTLNGAGLSAEVISYGASLKSLHLDGLEHSLVLGLPKVEDYINHSMYFGATVGRFANRISNAEFDLAGETYKLDQNFLDRHILHGGREGSGNRNWELVGYDERQAHFRDVLPAGHMGFPGKLTVDLVYELKTGPSLSLTIDATTDAPTVCNFAHHSYFNLSGAETIRAHELTVLAAHYLAVDSDLIPRGEPVDVREDPFDFREGKILGETVMDTGRLLDHNFCLSQEREEARLIAMLKERNVGVSLEVWSTEPGLQVYDGSSLGSYRNGAGEQVFHDYAGLALEPQGWPDSPNRPEFPSDVLLPGNAYRQNTFFKIVRD